MVILQETLFNLQQYMNLVLIVYINAYIISID